MNQFGKYESEKTAEICNGAHYQRFPIVIEDISIDSIKISNSTANKPIKCSNCNSLPSFASSSPTDHPKPKIHWKVDSRLIKLKQKKTILWKRWNDSVSGFLLCIKRLRGVEGNQRFRARLLSGSDPRAPFPVCNPNPNSRLVNRDFLSELPSACACSHHRYAWEGRPQLGRPLRCTIQEMGDNGELKEAGNGSLDAAQTQVANVPFLRVVLIRIRSWFFSSISVSVVFFCSLAAKQAGRFRGEDIIGS